MIADTLLPDDRDRARRQRLPDGHPRVHAHAATATRCSRSTRRSGPPPRHADGHALAAARRDRAAGRRPHRAGRLGVARARPHPAVGVLRHAGRTAPPTTPSTSTRSRRCRGGRVLLSARDTSAIYLVDRRHAGTILWTLGGKASDFRLGPGARFWFQHDARMLPGGRVSLFDDEAGPPQKAPSSRGLVLALDRRRAPGDGRAQLPARAGHLGAERGQRADAPGGDGVRRLRRRRRSSRSSRAAAGCSSTPSCPDGDGSYRVLRFPWSATPRTRPALAVRRTAPRPRRRLRELERGHDGRALAGAGAAATAVPLRAAGRRRRGTGSRPASTSPRPRPGSRCARWGARAPPRDLGAGGRAVTAPGSAADRLARRVLPRAVVLAARVDGAAAPRRRGAAPRCTARAASSCSSPSTTRAARWRSSTSRGGCAGRDVDSCSSRSSARGIAGDPGGRGQAPLRDHRRAAPGPARRARRSSRDEPARARGHRVPRRAGSAAGAAGPGARVASAWPRCSGCGSADGPVDRRRLRRALARASSAASPRADGAARGVRRNERRMRRRGPYDTPAAWVHGQWFFAHDRSAQIGAPPRRARAGRRAA